jgi:hypothetical protein
LCIFLLRDCLHRPRHETIGDFDTGNFVVLGWAIGKYDLEPVAAFVRIDLA